MRTYQKIIELADQMGPELTKIRRDFHKHAETGWFEMRTSSIIARKLTDMGYEVLTGEDVCDREARMGVPSDKALQEGYERAIAQGADPEFVEHTKGGMTGVIGILRCGEGPTVAMRFDIDALGVFESQEPDHRPFAEGYASINYGSMHACGHDGHATIGIGVAKTLMEIRDQLHGTVKLIFQPAEEGVRGAKSIVAKGHLEDVDYLLSGHLGKRAEGTDYNFSPGSYGGLATCKYDVTFRGLAAHAGGAPHNGKNAIQAAAAAVTNLYAIPRHGAGATRINVGKLIAGSGRNVIADEAFMEIEVRGATAELNAYMCEKAERVLKASAEMYDCTVEMKLMGMAEPMESSHDLADQVTKVCLEKLGLSMDPRGLFKSGGSEDCCYMVNRVQELGGKATFMRLYTEMAAPGHHRRYDFQEHVLPTSVKIYAANVYNIMK